jgi:hypothetical protein
MPHLTGMTWLSVGLRRLYLVGLDDVLQRVSKFYLTGSFTGQLIITITGHKNGAILPKKKGYGLKNRI